MLLLKLNRSIVLRNWWPVALWLLVIRLESTSYASSDNTFNLLYRCLYFAFGRLVDVRTVHELDHILRKSGHFVGYAVLSGLTFLALSHTYRDRLQPVLKRRWGVYLRDRWQFSWALAAVLLTVVTASFDEINQTFIPSRTGRWQDVVIDTSGALVLQILIYFVCRGRCIAQRQREFIMPELSLSNPNE